MAPRVLEAKPAYYGGVWYRSRLEACWAAFFNAHKIENAEYERRWIQFDDGTKYQPDFYLPDCRTWVEVKGVLDERSLDKVLHLARYADEHDQTVILAGGPAGLVFGQVTAAGELNLATRLVRCRHCDQWTFSAILCRYCGIGNIDHDPFIDAHSPFQPCRLCTDLALWDNGPFIGRSQGPGGVFVMDGEFVGRRHVDDITTAWAEDGLKSISVGLQVINSHLIWEPR